MRAYAAHRDRLLVVDGFDAGDSPASDDELPRTSVDSVAVALEGRRLEGVAAHPAAPDRAFVATFDAGLFVTRDGGETFEPAGDAVEHDAVTAVAVDPSDPDVIWAGTEPSRLYRSTDAGRSFERVEGLLDVDSADEWSFPPRPDTHHVRWIEPDPNDARCYVGIEAGALVVYAPDGAHATGLDDGSTERDSDGATWIDRPPGSRRDNHQLATHAATPGRVYSAAGDGYAESADGGESWTTPTDGLEHRYVWSVLPDPGDPDRVLVTAARGPGRAHSPPGESYLYRRTAGEPWRRLDGPLSGSGRLRAVLAGDGDSGHVYGLNDRGLYVSTDFGDTWTRADLDWPEDLEGQTARGIAVVPEERG